MKERRSIKRIGAVAVAAVAVAATAVGLTGTAAARTSAVSFSRAPATAPQGATVRVAVRVRPVSAFCALSVRYADGAAQSIGRSFSRNGVVSWQWKVDDVAKPGRAVLTAACGRAGRTSRAVTVVGSLVPPKIVVTNQGFSVRPKARGSSVSYGVMLRNTSPNADALNVYVIVNFVMSNGALIGTKAETIDAVPAGTNYAYGGFLAFPGAAPVAQLEVVIQVGGRQRAEIHQPLVANIRIVPDRRDATWVGEVDGEIINDHQRLNLARTKVSTVVFDPAGNIIGGGSGLATASLPPGTRQAFVISSGVDAIPWARAARAIVSPLGTYTL
jgi:hypothetical protein